MTTNLPGSHDRTPFTRRDFVKTAGVAIPVLAAASPVFAAGSGRIRVGLIGCGGRGTGAAFNALEASPDVTVVALADLFADRVAACREKLDKQGERGRVSDDHCFTGFDAYQKLIASDVDVVLLATPPHFRPAMFDAAIRAGKHVFMEKPVAVDPVGVRKVLDAAKRADEKGLSVVAGTQRRHEACYLEAMKRVQDGAIGDITGASCYWNMGGLWVKDHQPEWSDMEWQIRNWLYFTWLSGDHIVEQHVHNLDVVNWALGRTPTLARGLGGRQVRTAPKFGHIFDHFAIEYEFGDQMSTISMCRQIDGTDGRVAERIRGTKGTLITWSGHAHIEGEREWYYEGKNPNPYVEEHKHLYASMRGDTPRINNAYDVATSTMTAIMGRMSCYTGKDVSWDHMMSSALDLSPEKYEFGPLPTPSVATPGRTPLI